MYYYSDVDSTCPWYFLDDSYKTLLGACLIIFGVGGVILNAWMIVSFVKSHLLTFRSHLLILNICTASLSRGVVGGFSFSGPSAVAGRWLFGRPCCNLFAFMHQLLGVFQLVSLMVLCYERYLLVKRMKYGKELGMKFYILSIVFCWVYSLALSLPPLISYGSYECDITGTTCALDWRYQSVRQFSFNVLVAILAGFVPIVVIAVSLWKAVRLNKRLRLTDVKWEQWSLTKTTIVMTVILVIFWIPQTVLTIWIAFSKSYSLKISTTVVIVAPLSTEASTMVPLLCYLAGEPRIRTALLGRFKDNYGIIRRRPKSSDFSMITSQ